VATSINRIFSLSPGIISSADFTSAELVQSLLEAGEVAPELRELILGKAGGNPLFVEELTHSLLENGAIQKENRQYVLSRKPSEIQVPDTIQGIIAARIDRVEDNLKRIMQVASVIGTEFAYRILQTIMGMREELKSHLLNLQGLEFIYEKQLFPELEYIFKHALTQEVAYNSLLLKRRKEIHEQIGRTIEEIYAERLEEYYELLAYHYVRSEKKEKAVDYLALACPKAIMAVAVDDAMAYYDQAMALLDTMPDTDENRERRISLLLNQELVFGLLLRLPDYHELLKKYEPMATGLKNPGLVGAFYVRLGISESMFGYFKQSIQTLTRAVDLCKAAGNVEYAGHAYTMLECSHVFMGNVDQALIIKEDALCNLKERFNLRNYVLILGAAASSYMFIGRWDEAIEEGQKALHMAEEFSDNSVICYAAWTLCGAYTSKGDLEKGLEYGELAVRKAPTLFDETWAKGILAGVWCLTGEPDKTIKFLNPLIQMFRAGRYAIGELIFLGSLGEAYLLSGEYDKARQTLEDLLELAKRCGSVVCIGTAHFLLGKVALETNLAQAGIHFEKSLSIYQQLKAENVLALPYSGLGRYYKRQGDTKQAREYLTKALEIFERGGHLIEPDKVRAELAELPEAG